MGGSVSGAYFGTKKTIGQHLGEDKFVKSQEKWKTNHEKIKSDLGISSPKTPKTPKKQEFQDLKSKSETELETECKKFWGTTYSYLWIDSGIDNDLLDDIKSYCFETPES